MNRLIYAGGAIAAAFLAGVVISSARAADLNGGGMADLEERVAELEATVARKGNRRMTLTISGQVSKAILWTDGLDGINGDNKLRVIDNGNSGTRFRFVGEGKISPTMKAGFLIELGIDETKGRGLYDIFSADDISLRHSAVWLESALGKVTLGQTSTATDGIVEIDLSNSNIASLPMSVEPLWTFIGAPSISGISLNPTPFDGGRAQIVRYDSPTLAGFTASAAWGGGQTASYDDMFDVALRYVGEFSGIRFAFGAGYRVESYSSLFSAPDTKTLGGSASVMHTTSGLFLTAFAARQDDNLIFGDLQMWQVRGGVERKWFDIGRTTLFAEYGDHKLKSFGVDSTFLGGGIVQSIDAAAMDIGFAVRAYDFGGAIDSTVGMGFARIQF